MKELSQKEAAGLDRRLEWGLYRDPVSQASLWVPEVMYEWQCRVLRECMAEGARVAVVTPNESGKTSVVVPVLGLSWMAAFPGGQVVSTAGVSRQIEENLWPVLRASLQRYPMWKITDDLSITAPSVEGVPSSTWKAFTTKDPQYAEGFHSRWYRAADGRVVYAPLLVIIDEAKSFEDEAIIRALVKRCNPDVCLMISTPGEDTGPFYDAFHLNKGKPWKTFEIGWSDCPHLRRGMNMAVRQETIDEMGATHPFVLSWIFGKFYRAGGRLVFDRMEDVSYCMSGMVPRIRGDRRVALDFSGGGDEQVFAARDGNVLLEIEAYHEQDTMRLADKLLAKCRKLNVKPEDVVADNGGLGKPIIDYMEQRGFAGIRRYMANEKARDQSRFASRATEDCYELRHLVSERAVRLLKDDVLLDQMRKRRYVMPRDDSNRIRLESKEVVRNRGEKSPDRLDTVTMLFADMPPIEAVMAEIEDKTPRHCPTLKSVMEAWREGGDRVDGVFAENAFEQ
jgi:hypothetical protein